MRRWIVVALLAVFAGTAYGAALSKGYLALITPDMRAFTFCSDDKIRAFIDLETLASRDAGWVLRHEMKHMETMARFPSCAAYLSWSRQGDNLALVEAEAWCASALGMQEAFGWSRDLALNTAAHNLAYGYPHFELSVRKARALIDRFCV